MSDTYKAVTRSGKGIYKEKMSKFIAFSKGVTTPEEARAFVKQIQNEYHDARHVCWAYMLGPARQDWQLNDNGEPSGTAGKPILGQINSFGVTDVVIAVVRYFGGIKLGTSGLTQAYREAARLALEDSAIEERREMRRVRITFPYMSMNEVMKIAKQGDVAIESQIFDNTCELTLSTPKDNYANLANRLRGVDGVSLIDENMQ